MRPILLKIEIKGVELFKDGMFSVNFLSEKRVYEEEVEEGKVTHLCGANYKQNVVAFAGINASGKTSSLALISFVLNVFVVGQSLNYKERYCSLFSKKAKVKLFFQIGESVYYTESDFFKDENDRFVFEQERVFQKVVTAKTTKKDFLKFSDAHKPIKNRKQLGDESKFLKEEDSIIPTMIRGDRLVKNYVEDTVSNTNLNVLYKISGMNTNFIQYLDPNIEVFRWIKPKKSRVKEADNIYFELKFKGKKRQIIDFYELDSYLSSGTIKGLSLLSSINSVMQSGGYLIVDELENHLNKEIVKNIISFFTSDVNRKGATLIFSTHYSEILDSITRKDAIKILRKTSDKIELDSLSELAKTGKRDRTDIKSSDLILSGIFDTAPSYERFMDVRNILREKARGKKDA